MSPTAWTTYYVIFPKLRHRQVTQAAKSFCTFIPCSGGASRFPHHAGGFVWWRKDFLTLEKTLALCLTVVQSVNISVFCLSACQSASLSECQPLFLSVSLAFRPRSLQKCSIRGSLMSVLVCRFSLPLNKQYREFLREIQNARDTQTRAVARRARLLDRKPFPHPKPWNDSPLLDPARERQGFPLAMLLADDLVPLLSCTQCVMEKCKRDLGKRFRSAKVCGRGAFDAISTHPCECCRVIFG